MTRLRCGPTESVDQVLARARANAGVREVPTVSGAGAPPAAIHEEGAGHATGAGKAGSPPQPAAGETPAPAAAEETPRPNSPEDAGFLTPEQRAAAAPRHEPHACKSCGAPVLWAQTLDPRGERVPREDGKGWRAMPVDFAPTLEGNVQIFHRQGEGIVARVYRNAAAAPSGAILRTSHFVTCPNAKQHRRGRR